MGWKALVVIGGLGLALVVSGVLMWKNLIVEERFLIGGLKENINYAETVFAERLKIEAPVVHSSEGVDLEWICNTKEAGDLINRYYSFMDFESGGWRQGKRMPLLDKFGAVGKVMEIFNSLFQNHENAFNAFFLKLCGLEGAVQDQSDHERIRVFWTIGMRYFRKRREMMEKSDGCACETKEEEEQCTFYTNPYQTCTLKSSLCQAHGVVEKDGVFKKDCHKYNARMFFTWLGEEENRADLGRFWNINAQQSMLSMYTWLAKRISELQGDLFQRQNMEQIFSDEFFQQMNVNLDIQTIRRDFPGFWIEILVILQNLSNKDWVFLLEPWTQATASVIYDRMEIGRIKTIWDKYISKWMEYAKSSNMRKLSVEASKMLARDVFIKIPIQRLVTEIFQAWAYIMSMCLMFRLDSSIEMGWTPGDSRILPSYLGYTFMPIFQAALNILIAENPLQIPREDVCVGAHFASLLDVEVFDREKEYYADALVFMDNWDYTDVFCPFIPMTSVINVDMGNKFRNLQRERVETAFTMELGQLNVQDGLTREPKAVEAASLPPEYSFFTTENRKYGECMREPSDQTAQCASCWAFATIGSLSHRYCKYLVDNHLPIPFPGKREGRLSSQMAISCISKETMQGENLRNNNDCQGGRPSSVLVWGSEQDILLNECVPYISGRDGEEHPEYCEVFRKQASACSQRVLVESAYFDFGEKAMMHQIYLFGPVTAVMILPIDFITHPGGDVVYNPPAAAKLLSQSSVHSAHVVQICGWGTKDGVPYWIVENSWGDIYQSFDGFHNGGFLRVVRNHPLLKLETFAFSYGTPIPSV